VDKRLASYQLQLVLRRRLEASGWIFAKALFAFIQEHLDRFTELRY
jgi:hypothetical protein